MRKIPAMSTLAVAALALPALPAGAAEVGKVVGPTISERHPYCVTSVLPLEAIQAGEQSVFTCFRTAEAQRAELGYAPEDLMLPQSDLRGTSGRVDMASRDRASAVAASVLGPDQTFWAVHTDGFNGGGLRLTVTGSINGCDGSGISMPWYDGWNDAISSTRHYVCGTVKHFLDEQFEGPFLTTTGTPGTVRNMNSAMNNQVSSMKYMP